MELVRWKWSIVGIVAVLLFGSRLPSVARSLGKSMTEFKKGMREFENEMHSAVYSEPPSRVTYNQQIETPHGTSRAGVHANTGPRRFDHRLGPRLPPSPETSEVHSH